MGNFVTTKKLAASWLANRGSREKNRLYSHHQTARADNDNQHYETDNYESVSFLVSFLRCFGLCVGDIHMRTEW